MQINGEVYSIYLFNASERDGKKNYFKKFISANAGRNK